MPAYERSILAKVLSLILPSTGPIRSNYSDTKLISTKYSEGSPKHTSMALTPVHARAQIKNVPVFFQAFRLISATISLASFTGKKPKKPKKNIQKAVQTAILHNEAAGCRDGHGLVYWLALDFGMVWPLNRLERSRFTSQSGFGGLANQKTAPHQTRP